MGSLFVSDRSNYAIQANNPSDGSLMENPADVVRDMLVTYLGNADGDIA